MTDDEFWKLFETIDREALNELDEDNYPDSVVEPLIAALAKMDVDEIEQFQSILAKVLYRIDGRQFADQSGKSGQSADGFLYCRCWVVANGKAFYESVAANPAKMPKTIREWCEPLLYVAGDAWTRKTDRNVEEWDFNPELNYETGSNEELWD